MGEEETGYRGKGERGGKSYWNCDSSDFFF